MYQGINSNDPVGSLITQLKIIKDDLAFLKSVGSEPKKEDYPFLERAANNALLNAFGDLCTKAAKRVETAGFWVWKREGKIHFHTPHGVVCVNIQHRRKLGTKSDWRHTLTADTNPNT